MSATVVVLDYTTLTGDDGDSPHVRINAWFGGSRAGNSLPSMPVALRKVAWSMVVDA